MMRADYDAATKWTAFPDWRGAELVRDGWTARAEPDLHMALVSGDLVRLPAMPEAGLWAVETAATLRLRIARDRALVLSNAALPLVPGWDGRGLAVSPASDAFLALRLEGPEMPALLREAVSADLDAGSPSSAAQFAGVAAMLYRPAPAIARLVVERPLAAYAWRWLETRS